MDLALESLLLFRKPLGKRFFGFFELSARGAQYWHYSCSSVNNWPTRSSCLLLELLLDTSRWHTVDLAMYTVTCIITRRGNRGTASRSSRYPIFFYACFSSTLCMVFCDYLAPSFDDRLLLGKILHHLLNRPYFPLHLQAPLINQVLARMEK